MGNPKLAITTDSAATRRAADRDALTLALVQFVPAGARVLDLGAAVPDLRRLLPHGCAYMSCGKLADVAGVLPCDLEAGEFPADAASGADIIVMADLIERVADVDALFAHLKAAGRTVLVGCSPAETDASPRKRGNNRRFGYYELARLFDRHGFRAECTVPLGDGRVVTRIAPDNKILPLATYRIAVLAGSASFGDRVGRAVLQSVVPGEAIIEDLATAPHDAGPYDLVVLGVGGSLTPADINDDLFDALSRGRSAIGIFGTQFRELIPRAAMDRLIARLDIWYARHDADLMMYGRDHANAIYLGDWLIDHFPLAEAGEDDSLIVGLNAGEDCDLARTVAQIQRHKRVYATQTAALLCALTSAETAAYSEPADGRLPGLASGEFHSLLVDVFGRGFPEKDFFLVERDAVARYRARVRAGLAVMRQRIAALLRDRLAVP